MHKRNRSGHDASSPRETAKRSKSRSASPANDENAPAAPNVNRITKHKKTTYFFQPTNTLRGASSTASTGPKPAGKSSLLAAAEENSHQSVFQVPNPVHTPTKTGGKLETHVAEHQSSDDSFDGVRWRASPRRVPCKNLNINPMLSSPLKNVTRSKKTGEPSIINEQTNSVLSKYGYGPHPMLLQTPKLNRTHSDSSSARSLRSEQPQLIHSPTLVRARSCSGSTTAPEGSKSGFANAPDAESLERLISSPLKESNLNSWIDKFELSGSAASDSAPRPNDKPSSLHPSHPGISRLTSEHPSPNNLMEPDLMASGSDQRIAPVVTDSRIAPAVTDSRIAPAVPDKSQQRDEGKLGSVLEGIDFDDNFSDASSTGSDTPFQDHPSREKPECNERTMHTKGVKNETTIHTTGVKDETILHTTGVKNETILHTPGESTANEAQVTEQKTSNEIDSEDPFSSDDEEILAALKTQSAPKGQMSRTDSIVTGNNIKREPSEGTGDDSDPFSDDDLDILPLLQNKKQESVVPRELSTQQTSDMKHAQSFQNGIKKLESLSFNDKYSTTMDENGAKLSFSRPDFKRFQIAGILQNSYKVRDRVRNQLILSVKDANLEESKIIVRGEYSSLPFEVKDIIHIIYTNPGNPKLVDDSHNLLIWNPDTLVAATTVSQQLRCTRRTVIKERYKFPGEAAIHFIIGNIVHEIFQTCFDSDDYSVRFMHKIAEQEIESRKIEIFSVGNIIDKVKQNVMAQLPFIESWFGTYYKKRPSTLKTNTFGQDVLFSIAEALDIEENIWSPMFGLKGMVDVTLDANFQDTKSGRRVLLPMEIKTGKEYIEHQAQSALYSLLFKDRYNTDVLQFLLVYTTAKISRKYDISSTDLKSLINLRNHLTRFMKEDCVELPELKKSSVCDTCEVQSACMVTNKLLEHGTAEDSGIDPNAYRSLTDHLQSRDHYSAFYRYWDFLITKEESLLLRVKKDLWTMTSKERETLQGKALGNLIVESSNDVSDAQKQFKYTFVRKDQDGSSFLNTGLSNFDKVIVSDDNGRFAIAHALVLQIKEKFITITTTRRIVNTDFRSNNFNGGNSAIRSVLHKTQVSQEQDEIIVTYRLDKDEMFHGMGLARFNILNLFLPEGASKSKRLIVDLEPPKYSESPIRIDSGNLNPDQLSAFKKVMQAEDYNLILGMPGTGKTTLIARLIKCLVGNNKTVLLASYTHSAVDNILLKVKDYGIDILRIGSLARTHKNIKKFNPNCEDFKKVNTYEDFEAAFKNPPVVAATCLGINDFIFSVREKFDYCIIDEASQVSMPVSLGPIARADKFILVGDHYQLPPLVTHPSAEVRKGLSQSLFKILADKHPDSVAELTYQYRMCDEIMLLSNVLVYDFRLKCGSEEVAQQSLYIPHPEKLEYQVAPSLNSKLAKSDLWIHSIFVPSNKVLFLNHDNLPGYERTLGDKVENPTEVELIRHIVEALTLCGVSESSIGVMSLYRHQLKSLKRTFLHKPDVEVLTADQYQGRDKDCIIISLVRSNKEKKVGDLLNEWRRINVAVTRSRSKLIMLGSYSTLYNGETLKGFIDLLSDRGWVYNLPKGAEKFYEFPFPTPSTQTAGASQRTRPTSTPKRVMGSSLTPSSKIVQKNPVLRDIVSDMTS